MDVAGVPLSNVHSHEMGSPFDSSMKSTLSPETRYALVEEKFAAGAPTTIISTLSLVPVPSVLLDSKVTSYLPGVL